jgi:hypothetical protein
VGTSTCKAIVDPAFVERLGLKMPPIDKSANGRPGRFEVLVSEVTAVNDFNGYYAGLCQ